MRLSVLTLALAVILGCCGCSTLERNPATTQLVTQYAVAKYLEQRSASERWDAAQRIILVASQLRVATGDRTATLATLRPVVAGLIEQQPLSIADRELAKALASVLFVEVENRIKPKEGAPLMNPLESVAIEQVLQWVITVAATIPASA